MLIQGKQMHIQIERGQIGRYVILPGDPGRCERIAKYFDQPEFLSSNREYTIWRGMLCGEPVAVCSTGIGGPSAVIALEELVECGADTFIRVGTSGGITDDVHSGDIVIATAAVRQEGTSREYMPIEYPAVAHFDIVSALNTAADQLGYRKHVGVIQSKDSFYGEIRPHEQPVGDQLRAQWTAWKAAGVLTSEMECSALFVASAVRHVRCGGVLNVLWNADTDDTLNAAPEMAERGVHTAIEALKQLISQDREKQIL